MAGSLRASRKRRARRGAVGLLAVAGIAAVVGAGGLSESADAAPVGTITEYPAPAGSGGPSGITAGPDGNLFFGTSASGIKRITTQGVISDFASTSIGSPITGPDGNLWFGTSISQFTGGVGRLTLRGAVTKFPIPGQFSGLGDIAAGPDGNVWFTEPFPNPDRADHPDGRRHQVPAPQHPVQPLRLL